MTIPQAPRVQIGRCPVDAYSKEGLVDHLDACSTNGTKAFVSGVNATMYTLAAEDPEYLALLEQMDVVTSDSFWIAKSSRLFGRSKVDHIAIVRLTLALLEKMASRGGRVFLLGTKPEYVEAAGRNLELRFPGLRVVGTRDGYFGDADEAEIAREIDASGAEVLLVGISTPKRESWMIRHRDRLQVPVAIGIGGLLDIFAGATKEGPDRLRNFGLMWAYRFAQEPRRMWKRYLIGNPRFVWLLAKDRFRGASTGSRARTHESA